MAIIRWFSVSANDQGSRTCSSPGGGPAFETAARRRARRSGGSSWGYCNATRSRGSCERAHWLVVHLAQKSSALAT